MTPPNDNGNNKKRTAGAVMNNPYAKKRPPVATAISAGADGTGTGNSNSRTNRTSQGSTTATKTSATTALRPTTDYATTFSQAFEAIEETTHFRRQMAGSGTVDPQREQEKAAQRALDQAEITNAMNDISDRDHHILLQPHVLYVSTRQRGNGLLRHIRNVPVAYSKMVPDYIMGTTSCALFLSIKYHQLYPAYVHRRLAELKTDFKLRVLLVLVDVEDNANVLLYLNKLAVTNNMTLILSWTEMEAARYLETFKSLDGKDASSIQKREQTSYVDQVVDFMTAAKPINKTDAGNLLDHFSTVRAVMAASKDELALCPGLGHIKVEKLYNALHKPFSKLAARKRKRQQEQEEKEEEQKKQQQQQQQQRQNDEEKQGEVNDESVADDTENSHDANDRKKKSGEKGELKKAG